ncbi:MAG: hypothetical protein Q8K78_14150 [Planctomycetaceae bacterium]|nr:hypothetical protein [Planctomycetaceae bacterium]
MTQHRIDHNALRAARAGCILIQHRHGEDLHSSLVDFLADAMHWCDAHGEDFHRALAQAARHFLYELIDQPQDERKLP